MLPPSGLSIIANTFPERKERAAAMGTWGAISGLAVASGPLLGGILVTTLGWRSIFWVNVPVIALAILLARRHIDESAAARRPRFDLAGQILSATSLAALAAGLIQAPQRGWTSPAILGLLGLAAAALIGFLALEHRRADPMLALRFFTNRAFSAAAAIATLMYLALNGFTFLTTLYLQNVRGESPFVAGLSLLPSTAVITLAAPVSARLTARYGPRPPVLAAAAMATAGLLLLTLARDHQGVALLAVAYLGVGAGAGLMNPPVTTTAMTALPADQSGVAAGVTGTARQVGSVLGVALVGSVAVSGPDRTAHMTNAASALLIHTSHIGYAIGAGATAMAGLVALVALTPPPGRRRS
ncbi:MFS transporter [Dactylosporangium sp. McL0621]|uniref:MFS transporter n=1 Tax=Dactylosporangium sp. McL0621 TaxID=3415678 RepID=UPI003CED22C4